MEERRRDRLKFSDTDSGRLMHTNPKIAFSLLISYRNESVHGILKLLLIILIFILCFIGYKLFATPPTTHSIEIKHIGYNSTNIFILLSKMRSWTYYSTECQDYILTINKKMNIINKKLIMDYATYYSIEDSKTIVETNNLIIRFNDFLQKKLAVECKGKEIDFSAYISSYYFESMKRKKKYNSLGRYVWNILGTKNIRLEYSNYYDFKYCPKAYYYINTYKTFDIRYKYNGLKIKNINTNKRILPSYYKYYDLNDYACLTTANSIDEFTTSSLLFIIPNFKDIKYKIAQYQNMIGYRYYKEKKYFKAIEEFKIALRINNRFTLPLYNIASCYALLNEIDKTIYYLKKYSKKYNGNLKKKIIKEKDFNNIRNNKKFVNYLNKL